MNMIISFIVLSLISVNGTPYIHSKKATIDEVVKYLKDADVVFVGEKHGDSLSSQWERFLFEKIAVDTNWVLSLEMWERDVQSLMDDYISGKLPLDSLLEKGRPWPNYMKDYHPTVEIAKERGIYVLCSNVPRYIANKVAKGGLPALDSLSDIEKEWVCVDIDTTNVKYKERFLDVMKNMKGPMAKMMDPHKFYLAQLIKDATMAESIEKYLKKGKKVFMITGSFHCDYHSGIIDQFKDKWKIKTVHPQGEDEDVSFDIADVVILRNEK